jgi:hypothetical protein
VGFLRKLFGGGGGSSLANGVRGTAQVVACSGYRGRGIWQSCHMQLVVQADGVPPTAVDVDGLVHRDRWPLPGMTLPVTVDPANPENLRVEWDELPSSRDRSRLTAEALAAAMRGESSGGITAAIPGGATVINLSGQDLSQLSEDKKAKLRMLGLDPNALAAAQGAASAPGAMTAAGGEEDRLARLERLARLRDQGVLSDAEFEAEKTRILAT